MDCKRVEEIILADYVDGKLEGNALKDLEMHLASCDKCRVFAAKTMGIGADLRRAGQLTPPPGLWEKIRAVVSEERAETAPGRNIFEPVRLLFNRPRQAFAFATAAVLILAVLITTRIVSNQIELGRQEEILSMVDLGENSNGTDYNLGTPAESYFL